LRFPYFAFNPRHVLSARDRVSALCEYSLRRRLPRFRPVVPSARAGYVYRSMVSADSLALGIFSLASLAQCSAAMPELEFCADESISADEARAAFARHGFAVQVWNAEKLDAELAERGKDLHRRFAKAFFWGRKTAFVFGLEDRLPVLYSDFDVLWFQDPWQAFELGKLKGLVAGTDGHRSLDPGILALMSEEHRKQLTETDPTCAGLYAVGADFALPPVVAEYMEKQLSTGTPGYFCEQTLLALTVKLAGQQLPFEDLPTLPQEVTTWRLA